MATLTAPTLQELLTSVRRRLGQPDSGNSTWSDDELREYLNDGVRKYFGEVIQNSEGLFTKQADLDITAGQDTVSLPSDFFEVVRLFRSVDDDYIVLVYDNSFDTSYSSNGPTSTSSLLTYRLRGANTLVLRDVPQFSQTAGLRIEYIAFPETLVTGGDSLTSDVSPVFKELIIAWAVYEAKFVESLRGQGVDTYSVAKGHFAELYDQFKDVIRERSHYPQSIKPWSPT